MPYEPLSKIYYKKPNLYRTIYEEMYNNEITVKLDIAINGNNAFFYKPPNFMRKLFLF